MGTKEVSNNTPAIGIADALLTRTQQRVLGLLFGKPDKSFYTNEIVRCAKIGKGTVVRELSKLSQAGLLTITRIGNQQHYQANRDSPIFTELLGIIRKTSGVVDVLKQVIEPIDEDIELAFVYGSMASGSDTSDSDIDLLLVGNDLTYGDVVELLIPAEEQLQREINPTLFTPVEYRDRLNDGQSFLIRIQENPRLMIKGEMYDIGKSGSDQST